MRILNADKRAAVLHALIEGCSVRSTARLVGVAKDTVLKLLVDAGDACTAYQRATMRNLTCRRLQCDEIWEYVYCKEKHVPEHRRGHIGIGDIWTWVAIDADTKLVPSWLVGKRDVDHAIAFMKDVAGRLAHRVQLTTDGHHPYLEAVGLAWYHEPVDYAMLVKLYGTEDAGAGRYSPPRCIGSRKRVAEFGTPGPAPRLFSLVHKNGGNGYSLDLAKSNRNGTNREKDSPWRRIKPKPARWAAGDSISAARMGRPWKST